MARPPRVKSRPSTGPERRIGQELREQPKATGEVPYRPNSTGSRVEPVAPTLAEIGITKKQSANYQKLAKVDENMILDKIAIAGSGHATVPLLVYEDPRRAGIVPKLTKPADFP